jgi:hypothetical protein
MTLQLARIQGRCETFAKKRFDATGHQLNIPKVSGWPETVTSEAEFSTLISEMYKWFHEDWRPEVEYLYGAAERVGQGSHLVRTFHGDVQSLRQAKEHTNTEKDQKHANWWKREKAGGTAPSDATYWQACAEAIVAECLEALTQLVGVVNAVVSDQHEIKAWRQRADASAGVDVGAQVSVVMGDLGLSFPPSKIDYLIREVTTQWEWRVGKLAPSDDAATELANLVARVLLGEIIKPLPCRYEDVLDVLAAHDNVTAALLVAHGLAESASHSGSEEFVELFEGVWATISTQ